MGASQSSQPPNPSRPTRTLPANEHAKQRQKATSISTPMKTPPLPLSPVIDKQPSATPTATVPMSVPTPAVAVPIPARRRTGGSLPGSRENSYVDQHKDADLLHRFDVTHDEPEAKDIQEEMDETEVQTKFGIVWVISDEFAAPQPRGSSPPNKDCILTTGQVKKYPLEIQWSEGGGAVYVLGTFTQRKALLLKQSHDSFRKLS